MLLVPCQANAAWAGRIRSLGAVIARPALLAALAIGVVIVLLVVGRNIARAQETFTISGQAVNGTGGATLPPGIPVTLRVFDQAAAPISTSQTAADGGGHFQFSNVARGDNWSYALSADYAGVSYNAFLDRKHPSDAVGLTVYETTQDVSVILVKRQVLAIADVDEKNQKIGAAEFVVLANRSDRTLLADVSSTSRGQFSFLRFSLPPQADELDVQSDLPGGQIISIGTGFAITSPVFPGEHDINFSFRFPYRGRAASYHQNFLQGAEVFQVLVPARLSQVQVVPLQLMPAVNIDRSTYQVWERRDLKAGEGLNLELTHLPRAGLLMRLEQSVTHGRFWQVSIPSLVGAALASLLLYSVVGGRRGTPEPQGSHIGLPLDPDADAGRNQGGITGVSHAALVWEMAVLDEGFQTGQVSEDEYQARRAQLKAQVLRQSSGGPAI